MRRSILIVDACSMVRARLLGLVRGVSNASIFAVETLAQAIAVLRPNAATQVILGIRFPDGFGLHSISRLKRGQHSLLVMALINDFQEHTRQRCIAMGADWVLDQVADIDMALYLIRDE